MTLQQLLLTKSMAGMDEQGNLIVNPFYGATQDEILEDLTYAKEVYASVWRYFLTICRPPKDILSCLSPGCDQLMI
jgi:hypothetical protein